MDARAGTLSEEQMETLANVLLKPLDYGIPIWFLNRQKDIVDGKNTQVSRISRISRLTYI